MTNNYFIKFLGMFQMQFRIVSRIALLDTPGPIWTVKFSNIVPRQNLMGVRLGTPSAACMGSNSTAA